MGGIRLPYEDWGEKKGSLPGDSGGGLVGGVKVSQSSRCGWGRKGWGAEEEETILCLEKGLKKGGTLQKLPVKECLGGKRGKG